MNPEIPDMRTTIDLALHLSEVHGVPIEQAAQRAMRMAYGRVPEASERSAVPELATLSVTQLTDRFVQEGATLEDAQNKACLAKARFPTPEPPPAPRWSPQETSWATSMIHQNAVANGIPADAAAGMSPDRDPLAFAQNAVFHVTGCLARGDVDGANRRLLLLSGGTMGVGRNGHPEERR
jgi:hypothetical protein